MTPSLNPISSPPQPSTASTTGSATTSSTSGVDAMATENTFLKLLVAQLQNQDPLQPQDGTQFVAQLAQFSGLEQSIQMRQDLDSIKTTLSAIPTTTAPSGSSPSGTSTSSSTTTQS